MIKFNEEQIRIIEQNTRKYYLQFRNFFSEQNLYTVIYANSY